MIGRAWVAFGCLVLLTSCEGTVDSAAVSDEDRAILSSTLEAIRVEEEWPSVPLDIRLLPVDLEGGLLPPGSIEHGDVPGSPLLREIASSSETVQIIERGHMGSEEFVVSLGVPVRTSETSADVYVAFLHPADPHTTFWRYSMTRGANGVWSLAKINYLTVEG